LLKASPSTSSFDQKPTNGMMPARASEPARKQTDVARICFQRPPNRRMSCSSCMAWITLPADMNSSALKKAWERRWKKPAP
jgi:hypothetical protein